MKVKVSDFIANYLVEKGISHNFTVPGGGAMHLNVSFGHQEGLTNIFVQHEQAAAISAEAYYRINNRLPIVCCTTGPGGTNTLTGVLGAWLDSIPMLVISGQVKYQTTVRSTGENMRILGDQEFDIVKVVAPMTKYAEMITRPEMVKYHLDKAMYLAEHGRPGPVWLDIPQDVQSAMIEEDRFVEFNESEMANTIPHEISDVTIKFIIDKIKESKRPVIYTGPELRTAGAYELFRKVIEKLNVPVVTCFDGIDVLEEDHPLYVGRAGDVGNRYGNWAVQNSDFVLTIGSRLGMRQVGFTPESWAREAYVVMVHPDPLEVTKFRVHVELPVRSDPKVFLERLDETLTQPLERKEDWFDICKNWKDKYPVVDKKRHYADGDFANAYCFMNELWPLVPENTIIASANGSACVVGANAFLIKSGQRFLINSGCASMGYDLPAAIGACFAGEKRPTICLSGDGSIQMNLQELQTVVFHKLPIKIFIINNGGYHSMRQTQKNLFPEFSKVGVGPESGDLSFPNMHKIADAYGLPYMQIHSNGEMGEKLSEFMKLEGYGLCEVFVDVDQAFEPKPSAMRKPDGTLVSPPMEDMAPFLPREELKDLMIIPLLDE
ncbi:thiamine pyrophosphate-binding protein [Butyrivibrio sp. MB2005]|uniref:thiamine pyrophosphate-binding protein n=1 Tax=Butyrivibrio sp. MB2005 TaxID=1280678 RepID=UPI00042743BA|nr:thiamine pyrophosphate-binding protein [Butyrivibrio sp. MB2005]